MATSFKSRCSGTSGPTPMTKTTRIGSERDVRLPWPSSLLFLASRSSRMTSPDSRMNWNKPCSYSRGQLPSQQSRQDLQLRLNLRRPAMPKSLEAQGHKCQMCRTCRYSHSHLKLTNHSLRTQCVNLKPSCLDSRSAAANSWYVGLPDIEDLRRFHLYGNRVHALTITGAGRIQLP
jgi:hypothetical protein